MANNDLNRLALVSAGCEFVILTYLTEVEGSDHLYKVIPFSAIESLEFFPEENLLSISLTTNHRFSVHYANKDLAFFLSKL